MENILAFQHILGFLQDWENIQILKTSKIAVKKKLPFGYL